MIESVSKSSLTKPEQSLVKLLQELNFGRVEDLRVRNGAPVFAPGPRVIRTVRMGRDNVAREELSHDEFLLKRALVELLEIIRTLRDDEVLTITVLHGLSSSLWRFNALGHAKNRGRVR